MTRRDVYQILASPPPRRSKLRGVWRQVYGILTRSHAAYWRGQDVPEPEMWGEPALAGSLRVHKLEDCVAPCPFHAPSDHHMADWPIIWRGDRGIVERRCPHGIGHPDPDNMAYLVANGRPGEGVHGCDGCCSA